MRYDIDDLVRIQFAANKVYAASLLAQGSIVSGGKNERLISQCEYEIESAINVINEVMNQPE